MSRKTANQIVLAVACLFMVAAGITLLPGSPKSLENDLGYHSLCPFAPWSSLFLLVPVGICAFLRNYLASIKD